MEWFKGTNMTRRELLLTARGPVFRHMEPEMSSSCCLGCVRECVCVCSCVRARVLLFSSSHKCVYPCVGIGEECDRSGRRTGSASPRVFAAWSRERSVITRAVVTRLSGESRWFWSPDRSRVSLCEIRRWDKMHLELSADQQPCCSREL